ncbi:MAG TPA: rRNA maturation RNase YbeY [Terrimicrobiaceae bacterium]|nr:rRNA maturation RNase YbeY [Terrimicrobiaceae bacterium]
MAISLVIGNRQRAVSLDLGFIRRTAAAAVPGCLAALRSPDVPLARLTEVEAVVLSDKAIARVHGTFFQDPTPTDVITFHHGEILLGAGVIAENARRFGQDPSEEAALCVIHGMLHLAGWDDLTARDAKLMARKQEQIFKAALRMV